MEEILSNIESIKGEDEGYSDESLFNISSWGADLSFREIISMYEEDELIKPELQRKYVWDRMQASRFIESILMGLPVPSLFFANAGSQKLIVDGYQRIMSVFDYVRGNVFSGDGKVFKLSNSKMINRKWRNKAFNELEIEDQRRIRSTTIHVIVFEQKKPENDDTSLYQIFERINSGGRPLTPQEIRNCIYQGSLNTLLFELNKNKKWRKLFRLEDEDKRMRDIEFILRFFLMDEVFSGDLKTSKRLSLKRDLNLFMKVHQNDSKNSIDRMRNRFLNMVDGVYDSIGKDAFCNYTNDRFTGKFHPAIFDAISVSFSNKSESKCIIVDDPCSAHIKLLEDISFKENISERTTDVKAIIDRINCASSYLFKQE